MPIEDTERTSAPCARINDAAGAPGAPPRHCAEEPARSASDARTARASHKVLWRDGIAVAGLTLATWVLCGRFNVTATLRRLTAPYERYQLDELSTVLLALSLELTWIPLRRYREARREITRRKSAEAQLTAALAEDRRLAQQYVALQET